MLRAVLQPVSVAAMVAALTGCLFQDKVESFSGPTMGSTYSVKYVRTTDVADHGLLQQETEAILAQLDAQVSTYRPDSEIEQFNGLPAGSCQEVSAPIIELVEAARQISESSNGALDLTLEPLLDLWGFGPKGRTDAVPGDAQVRAARELTGLRHLRVEAGQLCKDVALQLDFNSIAAGYAVDRVVGRLGELGVSSYLVEITGELKAAGRKPDGAPWRVAIEAPREGERSAQQVIEVDGVAISTSGDYRNYFEREGQRYSHTLDPATGAPITHRLASVTVAHESTLQADGLSTVLMVLGPGRGMAFAEQQDLAAFFVIRDGDGFATQSTAAFQALFGAGGTQ